MKFEKGFRINYFVIFASFVVKNILLVAALLHGVLRGPSQQDIICVNLRNLRLNYLSYSLFMSFMLFMVPLSGMNVSEAFFALQTYRAQLIKSLA